jgi:hypothetical protein
MNMCGTHQLGDRHCKNWGVKGHSWRHQQWQMRGLNFALKSVAEVMVANTTHQLVRKRETITELFTHEHEEIARFTDGADQIPLGLNACCVFFINGQNLVIGIVKTGA